MRPRPMNLAHRRPRCGFNRGFVPSVPGAAGEPQRRPRWVAMLTMLMGLHALNLFLGGMDSWRSLDSDPVLAGGVPTDVEKALAPTERLRRAFRLVQAQLPSRGVRIQAAAAVAMGLLTTYAVAAVLVGGARARRAVVLAAWVGVLYHLGNAAYQIVVVRKVLLGAAPLWVELMLADQGDAIKGMSRAEILADADTGLILFWTLLGVAGVGFSGLLLWFFGGKRGRTYYDSSLSGGVRPGQTGS